MITKRNVEALFTTQEVDSIIQGAVKNSVAMSLFTKLPNMSSKLMKMRVLDSLPMAYWVNNDTNNGRKKLTKMAWANKFITAEELAVIVPIKQELLDDADVDIWGQVRPRIEEAFGKKFDQAVFGGVDKPDSFRTDILTSIKDCGFLITPNQNETLYSQIDRAMAKVEEADFNVNALVGGLNLKSAFRNMLDTTGQPLNTTEIGSLTRHFISNGAWDKTVAKMIVGDFSQAVYSIRQDISYKLLEEAIIQDPSTGEILYNLAQEDMVALRVVFRCGWEIPNPVSAENEGSVHFPFAAIAGTTGVTTQTVTFTVSDSSSDPVENAEVTVGGIKKKTNSSGVATFALRADKYEYLVDAEGYSPVKGKITVASSSVSKSITLSF